MLNREAIFKAKDIVTEEVQVPEWGGSILVRGMSGAERDAFEGSVLEKKGKGDYDIKMKDARAKIVVICAVDEDGKPIFSPEDVAALTQKSASALSRLYDVAARLSGITEQDKDELLKN